MPSMLFIFLILNGAMGMDDLRLRIESTSFEPCPHIKNGRLISNNSRIDLSQGEYNLHRYGAAQLSRLQLLDDHGHTKELTLPGCFNVRVNATFTQTIHNPYVEAYIKTDRDEPCKKFKPNPYCPSTDNLSVHLLTDKQVTCRFCDLCMAPDEVTQSRKDNTDVRIGASGRACSDGTRRIQAGQSYPFELTNICTPSGVDLERQMEQKFGPSWHDVDFIRRGSILMTVHILDRRNAPPKPCLQLGAGTYKWKGPAALESRVLQNLQTSCQRYHDPVQEGEKPKDDYLGCYSGYINYAIDRIPEATAS